MYHVPCYIVQLMLAWYITWYPHKVVVLLDWYIMMVMVICIG